MLALIALYLLAAPLVNLTQWYVVRIRAHQAARYGVWLLSSRRMEENRVAEEVLRVFDEGIPRVRRGAVTVSMGIPNSQWAKAHGLVEVRVRVRMRWLGHRAWLEKTAASEVEVEESCVVAKAPRYWF